MKQLSSLVCCLCAVVVAYGQSTIRPNLYFQNQNLNYYNPAAGLNRDEISRALTLYGKHKIADSSEVWNKPLTIFVNYLARLKNKPGFYAIGFIQDRYSFYDRRTLYLGYTRQYTVLNKRTLSVGARAVLNTDRIHWEKAPQFGQTGTETRFAPDLDLGVQYQGNHLRLGLGIKNVVASSVKLDGAALLNNRREAYANLSYIINPAGNLTVAPYMLVQIDSNPDIDLGVYVSIVKRISLSYLYRVREFRSIGTLEVNLVKGLHIGLAVDDSGLYKDSNIDFLLGYNF